MLTTVSKRRPSAVVVEPEITEAAKLRKLTSTS